MSVHIAKGTRDFLSTTMRRRRWMTETIQSVFDRFGFEQLETPAIERIDTLMGKYGDEGEHLTFRILKRGAGGQRGEADLALRYDLTVPLARVVAMHPELRMPWKRYQIQPVWRAERPQRGRYREFVQCDADIAGCPDLTADAECLVLAQEALKALGFTEFTILLNDRKILSGIVRAIGAPELETAVLVAVDKLDKIGRDGVNAELRSKGVPDDAIEKLWGFIGEKGDQALTDLPTMLDAAGQEGVREVEFVLAAAEAMGLEDRHVLFDPTLARGLSYYTGPIYEIRTTPDVGSIGSGGRYDGLVGIFSKRQVPAVGVSLGLDRLFLVMEERGMFPDDGERGDVFVTVFDEEGRTAAYNTVGALRAAGVPARVWLRRPGKLGKQLKHASNTGARWAVVQGPSEREAGLLKLRDLSDREERELSLEQAIAALTEG